MTPTSNSEKIKFFVLFLGFSVLLGVLIPLATFGATSTNYTLSADGIFVRGDYIPETICSWVVYNEIYPATSTPTEGISATLCSNTTFDLDDWAPSFMGDIWIAIGEWQANPPTSYFEYINICRYEINNWSNEPCPPPPAFRVWGISPVSGTEITSTSTEFSFGWEGLATSSMSYYSGFWLNFREKITGIKTKGYLFVSAEPSGTATTSLENFEFDKNSDYYLSSICAGGSCGIFDYYTDLVSPEFYYTINVAGLGEIFKMTDFSTWYAENSMFATPTAIFISLTGFLEPVFSKVGEFGERITNFFDLDDAYMRGYDIGIIFPTFGQYIDEIEVFVGGFPLIKLFLISLLVLLGIFIIKLIMKFIPFFGG